MKDEEHANDWPRVDKATEVIRAYEQESHLDPANYGVAFMELGTGLENNAIETFRNNPRLHPSWLAAQSRLGLACTSAN